MAALYEIKNEIATLLMRCDDNGEVPADFDEQLAALQMEFDGKADNICAYIAELAAESEGRKAEIERMQALKKAADARHERLKAYLKESMDALGIEALTTKRFKLHIQKNGKPSCVIKEGVKPPKGWQQPPEDPKWDKAKLLEAYKAGKELPSAVTFVTGTSLRIR